MERRLSSSERKYDVRTDQITDNLVAQMRQARRQADLTERTEEPEFWEHGHLELSPLADAPPVQGPQSSDPGLRHSMGPGVAISVAKGSHPSATTGRAGRSFGVGSVKVGVEPGADRPGTNEPPAPQGDEPAPRRRSLLRRFLSMEPAPNAEQLHRLERRESYLGLSKEPRSPEKRNAFSIDARLRRLSFNTELLVMRDMGQDEAVSKNRLKARKHWHRAFNKVVVPIKKQKRANLRDPEKKPTYMIDPEGRGYAAWTRYVMLLLVWVSLFVPWHVAFFMHQPESDGSALEVMSLIVDVSFWIDLVVNFVTGYRVEVSEIGVGKRNVIYDRSKVTWRYLKSWFFIDFVACLSSIAGTVTTAAKLTRVPRILKMFRVIRLLRLVKVIKISADVGASETVFNAGVGRILLMGACLLLSTHIIGCLFHLVAVFSLESMDDCRASSTWISSHSDGYLCDSNNFHRYSASLYWAFTTVTTVGYGDISAGNTEERWFSMLALLIGTGFYTAMVGAVASVVQSLDAKGKLMAVKRAKLEAFCRVNVVGRSLRMRLMDQFEESQAERQYHASRDVSSVIGDISGQLRTDIALHLHRDLIAQMKFFRHADGALKPAGFILRIISELKPMVFQQRDTIVKQGERANEVFFVKNGIVDVMHSEHKIYACASLTNGDIFGELGCLMPPEDSIRQNTCVARVKTWLLALTKQQFIAILRDFPQFDTQMRSLAKARIRGSNEEKVTKSLKLTNEEKLTKSLTMTKKQLSSADLVMKSLEDDRLRGDDTNETEDPECSDCDPGASEDSREESQPAPSPPKLRTQKDEDEPALQDPHVAAKILMRDTPDTKNMGLKERLAAMEATMTEKLSIVNESQDHMQVQLSQLIRQMHVLLEQGR